MTDKENRDARGSLDQREMVIHEDCLELVANLADMNCSASISDGIITLEDGTQIDLRRAANEEFAANDEWKEIRGEDDE